MSIEKAKQISYNQISCFVTSQKVEQHKPIFFFHICEIKIHILQNTDFGLLYVSYDNSYQILQGDICYSYPCMEHPSNDHI